jgi:Ribosomal protein L16p/L10e
MRGAWGKPYGTVARVNIGQIILSVRCKDASSAVVMEALRRARYKFPGRQKIIVSRKWGFTNVNREDYLKLKEEKRVLQCVLPRLFTRGFIGLLRRADFGAGMGPMFNTSVPGATLRTTFATSCARRRAVAQSSPRLMWSIPCTFARALWTSVMSESPCCYKNSNLVGRSSTPSLPLSPPLYSLRRLDPVGAG